jgi:hypothetical protein
MTADDFGDRLEHLERALESPVIPGEVEGWADAVRTEALFFDGLLRERAVRERHDAFAQITEDDRAFVRQVEQMRVEEAAIRTAYDDFLDEVRTLAEAAPRLEPDEATLNKSIDRVRDHGLELVIRVRTQELAISTYLQEAGMRDRGEVD